MSEDLVTVAVNDPVLSAGRNIMAAMVPAENSVDAAIARGSKLLAQVAEGRIESGVAFQTGAPAMWSIWRALGSLLTARDSFGSGHDLLAMERDALGRTADDFGCSATKGGHPPLQAS